MKTNTRDSSKLFLSLVSIDTPSSGLFGRMTVLHQLHLSETETHLFTPTLSPPTDTPRPALMNCTVVLEAVCHRQQRGGILGGFRFLAKSISHLGAQTRR
ncbi:hypothetical protein E3T55_01100 [Cryobacterium frigoriphilum]|uniref:Uncharacterized protein n=1 Tax=Cryobacterium frigoriphilum TaxID=1259150 RepID=A0A4R9ABD2_9MICO|nr:hypothetical protein [Cryobacterium frigoriphilum]TFD55434.1 hypothetical protein E3T55_01100 [Cryobacterium frigoriphilum]